MSARSSMKGQLPVKHDAHDENPGAAAKALSHILESGARVQAPAVAAYVNRLREHNPGATPAQVKAALIAAANSNWNNAGDPDGIKEPLLNVDGL